MAGHGIIVRERPGIDIDVIVGDPEARHGVYVVANPTQAGPAVAALARLGLRLLLGQDPPPLAVSSDTHEFREIVHS